MLAQLSRLWRDRVLLGCLAVAFAVAVLMARPQCHTLARIDAMSAAELQQYFGVAEGTDRQEVLRWYAAAVRLPQTAAGNATTMVVAALLGAYLVGGCLQRPVVAQLYAGRSRLWIALSLYGAVLLAGLVLSLALYGMTMTIYARDCFALLGAQAWRITGSLLGWRVIFDLASFCPVVLMAFVTREMNVSFCGGAMLAVLTVLLGMLRDELWWLPNYALRTVVLNPAAPRLTHLWPSLLLLALTPVAGVVATCRTEWK